MSLVDFGIQPASLSAPGGTRMNWEHCGAEDGHFSLATHSTHGSNTTAGKPLCGALSPQNVRTDVCRTYYWLPSSRWGDYIRQAS
jgi:hypothetical protein